MKWWYEVHRVVTGLAFLFIAGVFLYYIPANYLDPDNINPHAAFLAALIISGFKTTLGFLVGHFMRKSLLPYIKFKDELEWSNNVLVIVFYVMGVWGCVTAG